MQRSEQAAIQTIPEALQCMDLLKPQCTDLC